MSWLQIENRHEEQYKRNFILCAEPDERKFIIDSILETFNSFKREHLEEVFDDCRKTFGRACERKKFLQTIKSKVEKNNA